MDGECPLNGSEIYTSEQIEGYKFKPGASLIVSVIIPTMAFFGMIFNLVFLFCVYQAPKMRTLINIFLAQLAMCDFSTLVFDTTRYLWVYIRSSGYDIIQGTRAGCTVFNFFFYFTYFVGVNFICLVTVERYFAICRPVAHRHFKGRNRARNLSAVCWFVGFLLSIAALVPQKIVTICAQIAADDTSSADYTWKIFHNCQSYEVWVFHILYFSDTVQFVVVFTLTACMYFAIIRQLRKREEMRSTGPTELSGGTKGKAASNSANRVSRDVTRMLIINGVTFFLLLGPYQIWNVVLLIWDYTGKLIVSEGFLYWIAWVSRLCAPINFSVNPLIYGGSNSQYRRAFADVFGCKTETNTDSELNSAVRSAATSESRIKEDKKI